MVGRKPVGLEWTFGDVAVKRVASLADLDMLKCKQLEPIRREAVKNEGACKAGNVDAGFDITARRRRPWQ